MISKLLRLYKRTHGLRQICNIAVYIAHSACTIHLLNLPDKNAKRDIIHGVKHLEEIAESWLCARRTLVVLSTLAKRWKIDMPEEAAAILERTDFKFRPYHPEDQQSPRSEAMSSPPTQRMSPPVSMPSQNHLMNATSDHRDLPRGHLASQHRTQQPGTAVSVPTSVTAEPQRPPRQSRYGLSQAQEEAWNHDVASRGSAASTQLSPSTLFGGIDTLVQDDEGWWVKDQYALEDGFGNWNGVDSDMSLLGNGAPGSGYVVDGVNAYNLSESDMYV